MKKVTAIYFSPTHTSKKIAKAFCRGTGLPFTEFDFTLPEGRKKEIELSSEDLVVLCRPVYGGHTVRIFMEMMKSVVGSGQPAVLISVYGNRHYDMALKDLYSAATAGGLRPIAWGRFIGEHSFNSLIQHGRPNEEDLERAFEFGKLTAERSESAVMLTEDEVPGREVDYAMIGMHGKRLTRMSPNHPIPSEDCIHCGTCAAVCPMGIIDPLDSGNIRGACLKCNACVKSCPVGAMAFPQEDFRIVREDCMQEFGRDVHVPEFRVNG